MQKTMPMPAKKETHTRKIYLSLVPWIKDRYYIVRYLPGIHHLDN